MELRNSSFSFIGPINRFLYSLEYETEHKLTKEDWNQLLGKDFTLQLSPHYIFATKTEEKYSVFFFLHTKNDDTIFYKGFTIKKRNLNSIHLSLFYVFSDGYLFVSDNLRSIKKILSGFYETRNKIKDSNFILFDSVKNSFLSKMFHKQEKIISGNSPSHLTIKLHNHLRTTTPILFSTSLNLSQIFHLKQKKITGQFFIHSISSDNNYVFSILVPASLQEKNTSIIKTKIKQQLLLDNQILYQYSIPQYNVFSNDPTKKIFQSSNIVLDIELQKLKNLDRLKNFSHLSNIQSIKIKQE